MAEANTAPEVFLSYSVQDRDVADFLRQALAGAGLAVWDDRSIPPGTRWAASIQDGITSARAILILLSRHSASGGWSEAEIAAAVAAKERDPTKILIPVFLDRKVEIPPLLDQYQALDLSDPTAREQNLDRLVSAVRTPSSKSAVAKETALSWENVYAQRSALQDAVNLTTYAVYREAALARRFVTLGSVLGILGLALSAIVAFIEIAPPLAAVAGIVLGAASTMAIVSRQSTK